MSFFSGLFRYSFYFTLIFCVSALANRYDEWLSLPPSSIHQWRQADGAALAWHYAKVPAFSEPTQFSLFRTGDAHAVGELPILYWLSGLITRHIGTPEFPLRWIGLLLLFVGFWAFGWLLLQYTKSPSLAALGAGILLTSPILAYYGPSFLPDAPAFCLILMMGACLWKTDQGQRVFWLVLAGHCAALAMMLKISMAILPFALAFTWALGWWKKRWKGPVWTGYWPIATIGLVLASTIVCRWWVFQYNAVHHATYFFADIRPIWWYNWSDILDILKGIFLFGLPAYASIGLYVAVSGCCWLVWKGRGGLGFFGKNTLLVVLGACIAFVLIWFRMLREHDYYAICLMVLPALLLLMGIHAALKRYSMKRVLYAMLFCWLTGLWHSHWLLSKRLELAYAPHSTLNLPPKAFLSDHQLSEAGIPATARILCPEDPSPNIALFALKRQGWTAYTFGDRISSDTLQKYCIEFGLTHLALRDTLVYNEMYQVFFPRQVLETNGWYLYAL